MTRKILSPLIICVLIFCAVSSGVSATANAATVVKSGSCGNGVNYSLDTDGVLTISGSGAMANYKSDGSPFTKDKIISTVVIEQGVTSIGIRAFSYCTGLKSITIPDGVTSIGEYAFSGCTGLTGVTIPESVKSIGKYAFLNCTGITGITLPDGVTSIGGYAFSGCTGLTVVTIPESVKTLYAAAFKDCTGLTSVTIQGNFVIKATDPSVRYGTPPFAGCTNLSHVTIADGVTLINEQLVEGCTGLTSITIPDSVTLIGNKAFSCCTGLTSITIPDSVTSIGDYAFGGCTGLADVTIPDSVAFIRDSAFYGCTGLTSVTIPGSVKSIGAYAFSGCTGLTGITIQDGVTSIGAYAFSGCTGLTGVTIPDSVTTISRNAFGSCKKLASVFVPSGVTTIGEKAIPANAVIYGYNDSYVQLWAKSNDRVFIVVESKDDYYSAIKTPVIISQPENVDASGNETVTFSVTAIGAVSYQWQESSDNGMNWKNSVLSAAKTSVLKVAATDAASALLYRCAVTNANGTTYSNAVGIILSGNSHSEGSDHEWGDAAVTVPASCTSQGKMIFTCTVCGATKTESIAATGHAYSSWVRLNDNQHQRVCANDTSHRMTAGHEWNDGEITKEATAEAEGEKTFTCTVCGATRKEPIPKPGPADDEYMPGDVDGNRQILADDARLALRASAKLEELDEKQKKAADVDGSGDVLADDARQILRFSAKLQHSFEKT